MRELLAKNRWQVVSSNPWVRFVSTAFDKSYRLLLPNPTNHLANWLIIAGFGLLAAGVSVLTLRARRTELGIEAPVRRHFRSDTPIRNMAKACEPQQRLAQGLLDFIDNPDTRPPLTIGICGPWGSGKSSVMSVLRGELENTRRHVVVWFNAWRFHKEAEITRAFYLSILEQFRRSAGWPMRVKVVLSRLQRATVTDVFGFVLPAALVVTVLGAIGLVASEAIRRRGGTSAQTALPVLFWMGAALAGFWQKVAAPVLKVVNIDPGKMLTELKGRLSFTHNLKREFDTVFAGLGDRKDDHRRGERSGARSRFGAQSSCERGCVHGDSEALVPRRLRTPSRSTSVANRYGGAPTRSCVRSKSQRFSSLPRLSPSSWQPTSARLRSAWRRRTTNHSSAPSLHLLSNYRKIRALQSDSRTLRAFCTICSVRKRRPRRPRFSN